MREQHPKPETTPEIDKLIGEAREIVRMAESLRDHGLPAEAVTFGLAAAQRLRAARVLQDMCTMPADKQTTPSRDQILFREGQENRDRAWRAWLDGPQTVLARYDTKLLAAKHDVVECARRLSELCAEFDGDLSYCGEYLDALWSAIDRVEAREKELCIR